MQLNSKIKIFFKYFKLIHSFKNCGMSDRTKTWNFDGYNCLIFIRLIDHPLQKLYIQKINNFINVYLYYDRFNVMSKKCMGCNLFDWRESSSFLLIEYLQSNSLEWSLKVGCNKTVKFNGWLIKSNETTEKHLHGWNCQL